MIFTVFMNFYEKYGKCRIACDSPASIRLARDEWAHQSLHDHCGKGSDGPRFASKALRPHLGLTLPENVYNRLQALTIRIWRSASYRMGTKKPDPFESGSFGFVGGGYAIKLCKQIVTNDLLRFEESV